MNWYIYWNCNSKYILNYFSSSKYHWWIYSTGKFYRLDMWILKYAFSISFSTWLWNRLISAWLEPVPDHDEKHHVYHSIVLMWTIYQKIKKIIEFNWSVWFGLCILIQYPEKLFYDAIKIYYVNGTWSF